MKKHALTWDDLTLREPALATLRREIERVRDFGGEYFCANEFWYGWSGHEPGFLRRLNGLVGRSAQRSDPVLRSAEAYDVAYRTLRSLLPRCRNCSCWLLPPFF